MWQNWCLARNIDNKIECFAPRDLDEILTKFYAEVRKKRWDRVRTRFTSHYTGITRQVSSPKNYSASTSSGREFKKSQETLNSDGKCLRYQGKGKRPNRAQPYARIDEELFWSEGKLKSHNGVALTNVNSNSPNYLCVQVIWETRESKISGGGGAFVRFSYSMYVTCCRFALFKTFMPCFRWF